MFVLKLSNQYKLYLKTKSQLKINFIFSIKKNDNNK